MSPGDWNDKHHLRSPDRHSNRVHAFNIFITVDERKMMPTMNIFSKQSSLVVMALLMLAVAPTVMAQNIYKCTIKGQVAYTDQPCPGDKGQLIHKADDAEVIDQYLRLGQTTLAEQYADSHHLEGLYKERAAAHQQAMDEKADRQAEEQIAARERDQQARQQAIADADEANRARLRNENDSLRQQNEAYRDQLDAPVYAPPPAYWNGAPTYGYGRHDDWEHRPHRDHEHKPDRVSPLQPPEAVLHPCTQLAGGRVKC